MRGRVYTILYLSRPPETVPVFCVVQVPIEFYFICLVSTFKHLSEPQKPAGVSLHSVFLNKLEPPRRHTTMLCNNSNTELAAVKHSPINRFNNSI